MLAVEMKGAGMYISRGLSWSGAEFETVVRPCLSLYFVRVKVWCLQETPLPHGFESMYNSVTEFMKKLQNELIAATALVDEPSPMRVYWGMHIRFFKELCIAAKVLSPVES